MTCDNVRDVHEPVTIKDTPEVAVAYCAKCKEVGYFRKDAAGHTDPGYNTFFRKDTLQPSQNLYYKVHPERMLIDQV